jgi:hypothetical protein
MSQEIDTADLDSGPQKNEQEFAVTEDKPIKIRWPIESDVPLVWANQFAFLNTGHEVVLSFGQFVPTLHNVTEEEIEEYVKNATVEPVARIVMTPDGLWALFGLLERNIKEADSND